MSEIKDVDIQNIASSLDALLSASNLSKVTADGAGFEDLPAGFYLTEVAMTNLKLNKNGDPMVSFQQKIVDNGWKYDEEADNYVRVPGSKGRVIFKNWNFVTEQDVKRFVSDMLKFENPEKPGEPLLEMLKENPSDDIMDFFKNTTALLEVIKFLADFKCRIYVQVSEYTKNGEKRTSQNLVKWAAIEEISQQFGIAM